MKKQITLCLILVLAFINQTQAQNAGTLDSTFNSTGSLILQPGNQHDNLFDVGIQSDGKIVFCGVGRIYATTGFVSDMVIGRRNTDGSADTSFGTNGYVFKDFGIGSDFAYNMAIQPDGKIVVVGGATRTTSGDVDWVVLRLLPNGNFDSTFNSNGILLIPVASAEDYAYDVIIQPDSKIVVCGASKVPGFNYNRAVVARLNPNGAFDSSFGNNGIFMYTPTTTSMSQTFKSFTLLPSGNIIAAGWSTQGTTSSMMMVGITSSGTVNTNFGLSGTYLSTSFEKIYSVAASNNGDIFICGTSTTNAIVAHFDTSGVLLTSFGAGGTVSFSSNPLNAFYKILIQADGKIITAGTAGTAAFAREFLIVRFTTSGTLDASFGTGGSVVIDYGTSFEDANTMAIQNDGKILVGGFGALGTNDMILARLLNDSSAIINDIKTIQKQNTFKLYPSPLAGNEFYVSSKDKNINRIELFSNLGKLISQINYTDSANNLIVKCKLPENLSSGIYFVKIFSDKNPTVIKFSKIN